MREHWWPGATTLHSSQQNTSCRSAEPLIGRGRTGGATTLQSKLYYSRGDLLRTITRGDLQRTNNRGDLQSTITRGDLQRTITRGDLHRTIIRGDLRRTYNSGDLQRTITRGELHRTITRGDLHRTTNKHRIGGLEPKWVRSHFPPQQQRIGGTFDKMGEVTLSNATTNTESEVMGQNG